MPRIFQDEIDAIQAETEWALDLDDGTAPMRAEPHPHIGEGGATTAYYQHAKLAGLSSRVRDDLNRTHLVLVDLRPDQTFETCEAVGHCPKPTCEAAPFHHFYWDGERDQERMDKIHGLGGKGHSDPMSCYTAVICKTCQRRALVHEDADDLPQI